jgi:hypothetical protein
MKCFAAAVFLAFIAAVAGAEPPAGFTPLFNGKDLSGWRGRPHFDPTKEAEGTPEERAKRQAEWDADLAAHWKVENGVIVNDGKGVFLTTDRDYADFELYVEWMFPQPCGDSGIYLRGNPQVQMWDPTCERDFKLGCQKGSGGLWNNPPGTEAKDPLVKADRPTGEWNAFRIRIQGDRVTVVLNDQLVVDNQPLPNYFTKGATPLPDRGPIQIQTHGSIMHVRNVFIRELGTFDGSGPGWRDLGEADFENVNCSPDTWTWKNGTARCTGKPVGVIRTKQLVTNLELSAEWRHLQKAGNSGIFLWAPPEVFVNLPPDKLPPGGIEVQVLDHGFTEHYEKSTGKKANWFTTNGDVFPVGSSAMKPFPPVAPDGKRSFPTSRHSRGTPEWNHYYVRAIDGEVRLWVNGHEVSGGNDCSPATGFLCLESEGAPVEFRRLRIRELPEGRTGFAPLFNGRDLTGWQGDTGGYEAVNGELQSKPGVGGNLLTVNEYDDFVLRFDFKLTPGANNGLAIRTPAQGNAAFDGIELQILDDGHEKYKELQPWQAHGSIYGVVAAERGTCLKPAGEWNTEEVTVQGSKIKVVVNGKTILDADTAPFRDGQATPDGKPHPGLARTKGHIGFAGHHDEVHFRNIRVKPL